MEQPNLGWTIEAEVLKIKDGDTITISISKEMIIRIINDKIYFDTPEVTKPSCPEEKEHGLEAKKYLEKLLTNEDGTMKKIIVHLPGSHKTSDLTHLSRFEGMIFVDGKDVSEEMIKAGFLKRKNYK